jgi:integrase/recombinase XerC
MNNLAIAYNPLPEFSVCLDDLIRDFLFRRSSRTQKAYQADLKDFAGFLGVDGTQEALRALISRDQGQANALVLSYKNSLIERHLSPNTVNRKLATLRSAVKLANRLGLVNWTIQIENEKVETYRNTSGTGKAGVRLLLTEVKATKFHAKAVRDTAIIRLLYDLALRRGEITGLDIEDFNPDSGTLSVLGKGRSQKQELSLPEPTIEALNAWIAVRGITAGPLFTNFDRAGKGQRLTGTAIYYIVRGLGEKAGIKARPHGLRHTAITAALDLTNGNVRAVQRFSRHKNVQTLNAYDDNRQDFAGEIARMISVSV